jgi:serine/threonine-protein kinase
MVDATLKKKIGKYEITGVLGRGGMGVVYRAEDKRIGRQVAIKTLTEGFSGEPEMLERFYREAQAGILQHPNIVIVYDIGDEDGVPFIVMEFVNGDPLDKLISSGKQLSLIDKLTIIEQVCSALGYAHQRGIIHRDIKPANVMVQPNPVHAKIVDFGIARIQSAKQSGLTRTGNVIGTIHYIAPERLKGQHFDGRSDIFATGIMLYLLLTGQLPFTGEDMAVAQKLVNEPHPPLTTWLSNYPRALDSIIDRALAKDPEARYASAEEFAADLHSLGDELKKAQVSELLTDAERLTNEEQFGRAREVLLQLVGIDPQHTTARQLLGVVGQNLARMQRAEQVFQLLAEAEEALASSRYAEALGSLDQAIKLDPENEELKARLEAARNKKRRYDEIGTLITQADSLRDRGDLTGAMNVVERAISLDQTDSRVRGIYADISRQAKLAAQQGQIREMMGKARQELSSRQFTAAIEILREVGKLDPSLPEMENLLQTAVSGQEQERRRKVVEQIQAEIENCLASEDYDRATELLDRAVERLPSESSLLQLKTRVALQTRKVRARRLIDSTAAKAQEVFVHSPGEALLIVQKALQELPGEERLLALEDSLRQRLKSAEKEEIRGRYLREAQEAIDHSQFEKAVEVLESYQVEFADAQGVGELLEFAKSELAQQQRRGQIAACVAQARALMQQEQFAEAIRLLEPASAETSDPSLGRLLEEARTQKLEADRKADALLTRVARLRERGQLDEAIGLLQGLPASAAPGTPLNALLSEIRAEQARQQAKEKALAAASKAFEQGDFQAAIESLQSVQRAYGDSPDLASAIAEIESRRVQHANEAVAKAVETARAALLANDAAAALKELRSTAELVEFASPTGQTDWRRLNAEASKPATRRTGQTAQVGLQDAELSDAGAPKRKLLIPLLGGGVFLVVVAVLAIVFHPWSAKQAPETSTSVSQQPGVLQPTAPPPTTPSGTLLIKGSLEGVQVFVDGPIKGFTQKDGILKLPLDPGPHTIRLSKPGYLDFGPASVTVSANGDTSFPYSLTASNKPPPPPTAGFLNVRSTVGAVVKVDGAPQGNIGPDGTLIVTVAPGKSHSLEIGRDGYQTASQPFSIKAGDNINVLSPLIPNPVQPKVETPQVQPVQIVSFSPTASQIVQGDPITLQWTTINASDVSIDNAIGEVGKNSQTTVYPSKNTTYTLTAKGSGGTQQRTVNIVVEPKAEKPAAPVASTPAKPVDETPLIQAVLNNFNAALSARDVTRMQAIWPNMPADRAKGYRDEFKDLSKKAKVSDDCQASSLSISGDSANWPCVENTVTPGEKPQSWRMQITFTKKNGAWIISSLK